MRARIEMRMPSVSWPEAPTGQGVPGGASSASPTGVIRTWLATGARMFVIDPRRARGRHSRARQMLVDSSEVVPSGNGVWRDMVSALRRHSVLSGLAQLSREDRQVLTSAYLLGHTNQEIAAMMSVSVSTVSRRLSAALARLEEQVLRTGTWVSSIVLLALSLVRTRTRGLVHLVSTANAPVSTGSVVAAAAGVATVVSLGLVALSPDGLPSRTPASRAAAGAGVSVHIPGGNTQLVLFPVPTKTDSSTAKGGPLGPEPGEAGQSPHRSGSSKDPGCDGKPTSAAPAVPVGSHTNQPRGAPVTHPTAGGCGPHGIETS